MRGGGSRRAAACAALARVRHPTPQLVRARAHTHPRVAGWCRTQLSGFKGPRDAAQGAETPAWLALGGNAGSGALPQRTGGFYYDKRLIAW